MSDSNELADFFEDREDLRTPQQKEKQQRQLDIRRGIEDYFERKSLADEDDWYNFD